MMQREIELLKICLKEITKQNHPNGIPGLTRRWDEMLRRWDDASHHPKGILSMLAMLGMLGMLGNLLPVTPPWGG